LPLPSSDAAEGENKRKGGGGIKEREIEPEVAHLFVILSTSVPQQPKSRNGREKKRERKGEGLREIERRVLLAFRPGEKEEGRKSEAELARDAGHC